jgi:hypothetical protein
MSPPDRIHGEAISLESGVSSPMDKIVLRRRVFRMCGGNACKLLREMGNKRKNILQPATSYFDSSFPRSVRGFAILCFCISRTLVKRCQVVRHLFIEKLRALIAAWSCSWTVKRNVTNDLAGKLGRAPVRLINREWKLHSHRAEIRVETV